MAMRFPGMDPYLENSAIFPGIHGPMITYLRDQLSPGLRPRYVASVGERVYVETPASSDGRAIIPDVWVRHIQSPTPPADSPAGSVAVIEEVELDEPTVIAAPDLEITQPYIEILDREADMRVVTIIELVSPSNKYAGPGRESYLLKQREVLHSDTHLVEIDLIRRGPHVLAVWEYLAAGRLDYDYLVSVHRAHARQFEIYPRKLQEPLPRIRIPLAGNDPDIGLDIRAGLEQAYIAGSYGQRIDYSKPCEPELTSEQQTWASGLHPRS